MNITISAPTPSHTNFSGRTVPPKEVVHAVLYPLWEKNPSVEYLVKESAFTNNVVVNWFKETFGKSAAKVMKDLKNEQLKKRFFEYRKAKMSDEEIAKAEGMSLKWVKAKLVQFNMVLTIKNKMKLLDENLPWMLEAGYTLSKIHKSLGIGFTMISNWMSAKAPEGITKFRHNNNIEIWHDYENTHAHLKKEFTEYFNNGGTMTGAVKKFDMYPQMVYKLMNIFGIKPKNKNAEEIMAQKVPEMMKERKSLPKMSKELSKDISISAATIRRWIKKTYGKDYKDIKASYKRASS